MSVVFLFLIFQFNGTKKQNKNYHRIRYERSLIYFDEMFFFSVGSGLLLFFHTKHFQQFEQSHVCVVVVAFVHFCWWNGLIQMDFDETVE